MNNYIILHGSFGSKDGNWFPWLKKELENKLKAGEKETPIVYQEADGIMIYTQGKDRKEQIEKYQKEHPNEEVSKRVAKRRSRKVKCRKASNAREIRSSI